MRVTEDNTKDKRKDKMHLQSCKPVGLLLLGLLHFESATSQNATLSVGDIDTMGQGRCTHAIGNPSTFSACSQRFSPKQCLTQSAEAQTNTPNTPECVWKVSDVH